VPRRAHPPLKVAIAPVATDGRAQVPDAFRSRRLVIACTQVSMKN